MKDDLQKLLIQFQVLEANFKELQERAGILNEKIEEIEKTRTAIEDLKQSKPSKALIPLGSGNFISGTIESTEDIIIGIGSGVAIKKKREEAVSILDSKLKELEANLNVLTDQSTKIAFELEKIQEEIEKFQK
jgi:prefoldin alpha subunit